MFETKEGQPISLAQIQRMYPTLSMSDDPSDALLSLLGVVRVHATPMPSGPVVPGPSELREDGKRYQTWVVRDYTPQERQEQANAAREAALERINAAYTERAARIAEGYPAEEQQSWPIQIREADAVLSGANMPTPWIDSAAASRKITREALAKLIRDRDTAYRAEHGRITGLRQALRDRIAAVPVGESGIAILNTINWPQD